MDGHARRSAEGFRPPLTIEGTARLVSRRPLPRATPYAAPRAAEPTPEWGAALYEAERRERERRERRRRGRNVRLWTGLGLQTSLAVGALAVLVSVASHPSSVEAASDPIAAIIQEEALR